MRSPAPTLLSLAVVIALAAVAVPSAASESRSDVESAVRGYAEANAVPGMVAVVVPSDGAVTTVPHGRTSDGAPVTADTPFRIASMAKAFTGVAVQQLAEAGRLRLDQPVVELLPDFAVADPRGDRITVRHLLGHTSGLALADVDEFRQPSPASAAADVEHLRRVPLATDPGTRHEYLNTNYTVLARMIEELTGRSYGDHLHDAVLEPLGMTATVATDRCEEEVPGLARGHVGALGVQIAVPEIPAVCTGNGGVVTTAADLTRWLRFQLGDGTTPDGTRLLSAASLRESHTPAPGTDGRYGLGWSSRTTDDGRVRTLHTGELGTFTSAIELSPRGTGAFVLTDAAGRPGNLAADLVAAADGVAPVPPTTDPVRVLQPVLLGMAALTVVAAVIGVVRAPRRAGRRRPVSAPALAVVGGLLLLPALSLLALPPSWTGWTLLLWMLPTGVVLALVLVAGGVAVLTARRLRRS
ncbi:serine hydrolase domain-containing protein [Pseudonocardia nematodicida]|uniref:Serine hydrolase domain-containing protein n=1 Tax=Pseudonocardia nematodicida TaxID=1206997 RepID=A0ABV1K869_9PSEU